MLHDSRSRSPSPSPNPNPCLSTGHAARHAAERHLQRAPAFDPRQCACASPTWLTCTWLPSHPLHAIPVHPACAYARSMCMHVHHVHVHVHVHVHAPMHPHPTRGRRSLKGHSSGPCPGLSRIRPTFPCLARWAHSWLPSRRRRAPGSGGRTASAARAHRSASERRSLPQLATACQPTARHSSPTPLVAGLCGGAPCSGVSFRAD
jgi:hypothetical protein